MVASTFALTTVAAPISRARVVANHRTAGVRHALAFHAATGLRCESGSLCSSSRHVTPRALTSNATSARRSRCSRMIIAGPQPDTEEEEGSALDFPEVRDTLTFRSDEITPWNFGSIN